jgi:hypothetical protein
MVRVVLKKVTLEQRRREVKVVYVDMGVESNAGIHNKSVKALRQECALCVQRRVRCQWAGPL